MSAGGGPAEAPGPANRVFVLGSFVAACCAGVDRLPRPGESLLADSFTVEPGGKGFNMAVGARRLGATVDCLAAVGDDLFAGLAGPAFTAADLPTTLLRRYPGPTGSGIGFIAADGENCLAVCPGANLCLSAGDVESCAGRVAAAAVTVAPFEIGEAPVRAAFALARRAGRLTLLNPSPFRMPSRDLFALTDVLVVNAQEAASLAAGLGLAFDGDCEADIHALADRLRGVGAADLVVTLGPRGSVAVADGRFLRQPAFAVPVRDTIGAGDASLAAFAVGLSRGAAWDEALRRGAAAGALMTTRPGTFSAFPTGDEIDSLIAAGG